MSLIFSNESFELKSINGSIRALKGRSSWEKDIIMRRIPLVCNGSAVGSASGEKVVSLREEEMPVDNGKQQTARRRIDSIDDGQRLVFILQVVERIVDGQNAHLQEMGPHQLQLGQIVR